MVYIMPDYKSGILTDFKLRKWIKCLTLCYEFFKHFPLFFYAVFFFFFSEMVKAFLLGHGMRVVVSCCFVLGKWNLTQNCFRDE